MISNKYILPFTLFFSVLVISCEKFDLERTNLLDPETTVILPDLVVKSINVTPAQVKKGNNITVSCQVKNQGKKTADFPIIQFDGLYYFLSSDTIFDIGDPVLGTSNIDDLSPGNSAEISGKVLTIPALTIAGDFYILFYADKEGDINESNEKNNVGHYDIEVIN